ncbi:MAG: hypothetical protein Q9192_005552 [Flavoplaca navasiana]
MAMEKDTLTMVVGNKVDDKKKTSPATAIFDQREMQRPSIKLPIVTGLQSPTKVHLEKSCKESCGKEARLLGMFKPPSEFGMESQIVRKRRVPATHGTPKRLRSNAPSHKLAGDEPGVAATASANITDTSPSLFLPVSSSNKTDIPDKSKVIEKREVDIIKDNDPLGYYEKDFIDHAKEHLWGPENASRGESTLTLREMDPLSYFCITEDDAVNDIQGSPSTRNTPTHNREATTTKDINPLGYFSTVEKTAVQEVNKVQSLPALEDISEPHTTPDVETNRQETFLIVRPYLSPSPNTQQRHTNMPISTGRGNGAHPSIVQFPASVNEEDSPAVDTSTPSPTPYLASPITGCTSQNIGHTSALPSSTIVTTRAEIKTATLEAMAQMKSEIICELRACMTSRIEDTAVGAKVVKGVDDADGVDEYILRWRQSSRSLLFRGLQASR